MERKVARPLCALLLAVAVLLLTGGDAPAASTGTITGTLVDGTNGDRPLGGTTVNLFVMKGDAEQPKRTVKTDANGVFRFDGLAADAQHTYIVFAHKGGVEYITGRVKLDKQPAQQIGKLKVYDTTPDDSGIRARSASLVVLDVDKVTQNIFVLETYMFENRTGRTFLPTTEGPKGPMGLLRFSLPGDVANLKPMGELAGREIITNNKGFATDLPLRPGETEVSFTYQIPYRELAGTYSYEKTIAYPTEQFRLLLAQGGPELNSPQLRAGKPAPLWGDTYSVFNADNVTARTKLELNFSALPVNVYPLRADNRLLPVGTAGVFALLLAIALGLWRRNTRRIAGAGQAGANDEQEALVQAIAGLDEQYEAGALDERSYRRERESRKQRLIALTAATSRPE